MSNKIFGGLLLIVMGILLLLVNLGYLSFSVFYSFFNLWPLILIAVGINIIFKNNQAIYYLTWGLIVLIIIINGVYNQGKSNSKIDLGDNIVIEKLPETEYAKLNLDLGASRVNLASTDQNLISIDTLGRQLDYKEDYKNNNETVIIDIETKPFIITGNQNYNTVYDFNLNQNVVWDMDINMGAISGDINLEDVPVRSIDLDTGAAELTFTLGNKHDLNFNVDTGASDLSFILPKDVGLKIKMDIALSHTNIDDLNLIKKGDYFISENYDYADVTINLDIDMGLGNINFSYKE